MPIWRFEQLITLLQAHRYRCEIRGEISLEIKSRSSKPQALVSEAEYICSRPDFAFDSFKTKSQ